MYLFLPQLFSGRHGELATPTFIDADPNAFIYIVNYLRAVKNGTPPTSQAEVGVPQHMLTAVLATARQFKLGELESLLNPPPVAPPLTWDDVVYGMLPISSYRAEHPGEGNHLVQKGYVRFGDPCVIDGHLKQLMVLSPAEADKPLVCKKCRQHFTIRTNTSQSCMRKSGTDFHVV